LPKYKHWNLVGSQAIQDIVERIDRAYGLFFRNIKAHKKASPPRFRKVYKYKSFTLKQAGYKFDDDSSLIIQKRRYKYHKSREIEGKIKTLTIKRSVLGIYFFVSVESQEQPVFRIETGKIAGMDFGLKTFLTLSDTTGIASPEFFKQDIETTRRLSKQISSKKKRSNNRRKAVDALARHLETIANKRDDWFFKLAKKLTEEYDYIFIEDLSLDGMKQLWGRKVSDLSFAKFVNILEYQASKNGCVVKKIDRFYPSSKTCNACGHINPDLSLEDRTWTCPSCGKSLNRDLNAALNIQREGASSLGLGDVRRFKETCNAIAV
jgi:putative transposase